MKNTYRKADYDKASVRHTAALKKVEAKLRKLRAEAKAAIRDAKVHLRGVKGYYRSDCPYNIRKIDAMCFAQSRVESLIS